MSKGALIHGALLATVLVLSYREWTKETPVESKSGTILVWNEPVDQLTAVVFETEDKTVRVERRAEGSDSYFWGVETRTTKLPAAKPPTPPASADGDAGVVETPPAPEPEIKVSTREYAIGDKGMDMIKGLAEFRVLRDLGVLSEADKKDYELDKSTRTLSVVFGAKSRSFLLGGKVFGGADKYAIDPATGHGYIIAGALVMPLETGENVLKPLTVQTFEDKDLGAVIVKAPSGERKLVRLSTTDAGGQKLLTWADASTPDKADQTMANFIKRVGDLRPSQYSPDLDAASLELVVTLEYQGAGGANVGRLELYKKTTAAEPAVAPDAAPSPTDPANPSAPAPVEPTDGTAPVTPELPKAPAPPVIEYYLRTPVTRVLAQVPKAVADRVDQDLAQIFTP